MQGQETGINSWIRSVVDFIYPEWCGWCAARLEGRRHGTFCVTCWATIQPMEAPYCAVCGIPYAGLREGELCGRCAASRRPPVGLWRCAAVYDGVWREAIHVMKYQRRPRTIRAVQAKFSDYLNQPDVRGALAGVDRWIPVPMHRARKRLREGNHADHLAQAVADRFGRPVWTGLRRVAETKPQSTLSRTERFVNVRKAFDVVRPEEVNGMVVGLVDDIVTTGATVEACARALKKAGAKEVRVLALARSL